MGGCAAWNPFEDWWFNYKRRWKRKFNTVKDYVVGNLAFLLKKFLAD